MSLHDRNGQRKYLTPGERLAFLEAARHAPPRVRTFCELLAHTGCRLSEALALTADRIDRTGGLVVFESLKKRRRGVYRAVPVPPSFLATLRRVHRLPKSHGKTVVRLWPWSRVTAWRHVCAVMAEAGIEGPHATPKGLRHGFGIHAVATGIPLNMLQKWLGHAHLATTAIYADATGPEEMEIASRMWGRVAA